MGVDFSGTYPKGSGLDQRTTIEQKEHSSNRDFVSAGSPQLLRYRELSEPAAMVICL